MRVTRDVGGMSEKASVHRAEDASRVSDLACALTEDWLGQAGFPTSHSESAYPSHLHFPHSELYF